MDTLESRVNHLLGRVALVRENLGLDSDRTVTADSRFADLLDSMGMVEFLVMVAEDYGVTPAAVEEVVDRRFGTVGELAASLQAAGWAAKPLSHPEPAAVAAEGRPPWSLPAPRPIHEEPSESSPPVPAALHKPDVFPSTAAAWLAGAAVSLPETIQPGASIDAVLGRPAGWLESHAGIRQRRVWGEQDPLVAATEAGRASLEQVGLEPEEVGALLVTSEAPPVLAGLGAALHHRLDLRPEAAVIEVGGACTGFLAALWVGQALLPRVGAVLVVSVEAPSHHLPLQPGLTGEAAALFGDAAAACLLCDHPAAVGSVRLMEVMLGVDGGSARLLQVRHSSPGPIELHWEGGALATRAVRGMAQAVRDLLRSHSLEVSDLAAVVAHGGNGRMPGLLARQLGLPPERVWSETAGTGNLGSASLPVAWAAHQPRPAGFVAWTAVGAGLTWAAALTGPPVAQPSQQTTPGSSPGG